MMRLCRRLACQHARQNSARRHPVAIGRDGITNFLDTLADYGKQLVALVGYVLLTGGSVLILIGFLLTERQVFAFL